MPLARNPTVHLGNEIIGTIMDVVVAPKFDIKISMLFVLNVVKMGLYSIGSLIMPNIAINNVQDN
jgi:hypothetical protein